MCRVSQFAGDRDSGSDLLCARGRPRDVDTALVLRSAITEGRRAALATALGIGTGVLAWGVAAAIGATAGLTASHTAFTALRIAGAVYLVWLGANLLVRAARGGGTAMRPIGPSSGVRLSGAFRRGLLCSALNPKVGVFYLAMLPQFTPAGVPAALMGVALAWVHVLEGTLYFVVLIATAHRARAWLQRPHVTRATDATTGITLIGVGIGVALKRSS